VNNEVVMQYWPLIDDGTIFSTILNQNTEFFTELPGYKDGCSCLN
jgi:hypothetical protein